MNRIRTELAILRKEPLSLFCLLLLAAKFLALFIFNFVRLPYVMDFDSSCNPAQAMEIWEQGTLFLENWSYQTTLCWDNPVPLAALLYGLSGNIFLSYSIAINIFLLAHLWVVLRISRDLGGGRAERWFAASLYFTVFSHGQLDYADTFLTNGGFYSGRILVLMLCLSILLRLSQGKSLRQEALPMAAALVLLFACGASIRNYMLLCALIPMLLWYGLTVVLRDELTPRLFLRKEGVFLILASAVSLLGSWLVRFYIDTLGQAATEKVFCTAAELPQTILNSLAGILQLFGGVTHANIVILSPRGISALCALVVIALFFTAFFSELPRALRARFEGTHAYTGLVACLVLVNAGVLMLGKLNYSGMPFEYRYWILPLTPMLLLVGPFLTRLRKNENKSLRRSVVFISLCCSLLFSSIQLRDYYRTDTGIDRYRHVTEDVSASMDIDSLLVYDPALISIPPRLMRLLTGEFRVYHVMQGFTFRDWGTSTYGFSEPSALGKTAILARPEELEAESEHIRSHCRYIKSYPETGMALYDFNSSALPDTVSGFPTGMMTETHDFPASPGYYFDAACGVLQPDGQLLSTGTGGWLLRGPHTITEKGSYHVTLHYNMSEAGMGGSLDVRSSDDGTCLASIPLSPDASSVTVEVTLEEDERTELGVFVDAGCIVSLQKMDFVKND